MCGIAGEFVFRGDRVLDPNDLTSMIDALAHRGPDSAGLWQDDSGQCVLMHSRTPRVDPVGGSQPVCNEDHSIWVTFNGEIYDHRDRIAELKGRGHRFASRCDAEVIPHLYEDFGTDSFAKLRGEFAFGVHDGRSRKLYLLRDRYGTKPLFYAETPDSIIFASEAKALFCHPRLNAEIDRTFVLHLMLGITTPDSSLFSGAKQVRPGWYLEVNERGISEKPFWQLSFPAEASYTSMDEAAEHFQHLLDEAVKLRLDADVQIGCYLSGGLDSSTVLESMVRQYDEPIETFSIRFSDQPDDEAQVAQRTAEHFGVANTAIDVSRQDLIDNLEAAVWHTEMPVMNSHGAAKYVLSERSCGTRKAVLTGSGADEFFIGYAMYSQQLLLERKRQAGGDEEADRAMARLFSGDSALPGLVPLTSYRKYGMVTGLFGSYPYQALRALAFERALRPFLAPDVAEVLDAPASLQHLAKWLPAAKTTRGLESWRASQHLKITCDLPWYIATCMDDRPEMAHAMEGRTPFLDKEVTDFALRLPREMLFNEERGKLLIRHAMRDRLPDEVINGRTKLFWTPIAREKSVLASARCRQYLTRSAISECGLFNPNRIAMARQALKVLPANSRSAAFLTSLLMTAASMHMLDRFFVREFAATHERFQAVQRVWQRRDIVFKGAAQPMAAE